MKTLINKLFAFMSLSLLFGIGISNLLPSEESVYASTITKKSKWHRGTPKELRGKYEIVHDAKHPLSIKYYWAKWEITARQVNFSEMNWPVRLGYSVKYRYISPHRYELKYNVRKNGYILAIKNYRSYLGKKGSNLISYVSNKAIMGNTYHKAKKK